MSVASHCAWWLLLVFGLSSPLRSSAAAPALPDAYRQVFEQGAGNGAYGCVVVGLIDGKEQRSWSFSCPADPAGETADRAFEIGALTDVFTGVLFAQAIFDHKVRLTDTLRARLPADFPWQDDNAGGIPLVALATQSSGLPATPPNLFCANADDPYANYAAADLFALVAQAPLAGAAAPAYSPLSAALLGSVLANAYDAADYPHLMQEKVLVPLGMLHTGFEDTANLLHGTAFGKPTPHWHYAALAGAAGLRSTLPDLLAFARANLTPGDSPLRAALLLARQPQLQTADGEIAFGWSVHQVDGDGQTWPLVWRASITGGFSAFVGFRTDRQQAVVILAASAADLAPIGLGLMTAAAAPRVPSPPYVPTSAELERYPGLYHLLDGDDLIVRVEADRLSAQMRGRSAWLLSAVAEDVYIAGAAVGITFVKNIDAISGLLLHTDNGYISAARLSTHAPRLQHNAIAIDAARLAGYAGDFRIDDNTMLRVSASAPGLSVQYTGSTPIAMRAYAADRFADADGDNGLVYVRDDHGAIDGLVAELAGGERKATPVHWRAARPAAASSAHPDSP